MIPKPVKRLLVEIVGKVRDGRAEENRREARKNPEKCLTALLLTINENIPNVSEMLHTSVEDSFFEDTLAEADRLLRRHKRRKVNGKRRNKKAIAAAR